MPVVLVGKEYWEGLVKWLDTVVYGHVDAIDKADLTMFKVVDTAAEAYEILKNSPERSLF